MSKNDDLLNYISIIRSNLDALEKQILGGGETDYANLPGIEGIFDGFKMLTADGTAYDVPANYAAKSKIVYGDKLKLIKEDGKDVFKQINKVPRLKFEGMMSKKEGLWYVLTANGTYKVSDTAAEFYQVQVGTKVYVLLPENDKKAPFATIDSIDKVEVAQTRPAQSVQQPAKVRTPEKSRPSFSNNKRRTNPPATQKIITPTELSAKPIEMTKSIVADDDLF